MLNWEEEVAPALAKVGLAQQPVVAEPQRPQPDQVAIAPQVVATAAIEAASLSSGAAAVQQPCYVGMCAGNCGPAVLT